MQFSEEMSRAEFERYFAWSRHCSGPSHRPNFDRRDDGSYCDDAVQRHWWTWHCATIHARQQVRAIAYDMLGCEADEIADKLADASLFGRWQDECSSRGERACHATGAPCFATCEGGAQAAYRVVPRHVEAQLRRVRWNAGLAIMRELSLRPYHGRLFIAKTAKGYEKAHKKLFKTPDVLTCAQEGRFSGGEGNDGMWIYLVWGKNPHTLAHELAHAVLHVFERCGIDPREAGGEPFCYLLSQLILDAGS